MQGREAMTRCTLFEKLLSLRNDVGLLSEEYDPHSAGRMTGNFPQAFSHTALISSAMNLVERGPANAREAEPSQSRRVTRSLGRLRVNSGLALA